MALLDARRAPTLLGAALVLLAVTLVANLATLAPPARILGTHLHEGEGHVSYVIQVHASPGDVFGGRLPWLAATPYAFAVTEGGEGERYARGEALHVYTEQPARAAEYRGFRVERPPVPEGVGSVTTFFGDVATPVDVVYVLDEATAADALPATPQAARILKAWLDRSAAYDEDALYVVPAGAARAQLAFDVAQGALALLAAAALVGLLAGGARDARPARAPLARLRDTLGLALAALVPLGLAGVVAAAAHAPRRPPTELREIGLVVSLAAVWLVSCIALLVAFAGARRALAREAAQAEPPA